MPNDPVIEGGYGTYQVIWVSHQIGCLVTRMATDSKGVTTAELVFTTTMVGIHMGGPEAIHLYGPDRLNLTSRRSKTELAKTIAPRTGIPEDMWFEMIEQLCELSVNVSGNRDKLAIYCERG